jgi:3-dehydroquinate dehydratase/shikimate dehydrogenase
MTLLAVSLAGPPQDLADRVRAAAQLGADVIELCVDRIRDVSAVEAVLEAARRVPFIITIRTRDEGGQWDGDEASRLELFERLARKSPGYIDVEFSAWQRDAEFRRRISALCGLPGAEKGKATVNRLILSWHNCSGMRTDLEAALGPLLDSPAHIIKAALTAADATDVWRILGELSEHSRRRSLILVAMGEAGLLSRVLSPKFGGFLTYAAPEPQGRTAPGQPTAAELLGCYRFRQISPQTRVFGLVGWPLRHSLSPQIHNAALRVAGIDAVYVPMPVSPTGAAFDAFMDYLTGHPEFGVCGLSVTLPHKEHAFRWLCQCGMPAGRIARQAGAVNTLTRIGPRQWEGDNTDAPAFLSVLRRLVPATAVDRAARAAVLGAGGAARAVIVALKQAGYRVTIYNRTAGRAAALACELGCDWQPWEQRGAVQCELIVNCTSIGMSAADESPLPAAALSHRPVVVDLVYQTGQTQLVRLAREAGCPAEGGRAILVEQAALQFERWHGRKASLEAMQTALAVG